MQKSDDVLANGLIHKAKKYQSHSIRMKKIIKKDTANFYGIFESKIVVVYENSLAPFFSI